MTSSFSKLAFCCFLMLHSSVESATQFKQRLSGSLLPGIITSVAGFVPPDAKRFFVSLSTSPNLGGGEIALHVSVRFDEGNIVVRNSYVRGKWMDEERGGSFPPFQKNANFTLNILAFQDYFQLEFNGENFFDFFHRIPQDRVNWIIAGGDVQVNTVRFGSREEIMYFKQQLPKAWLPEMNITINGFIPSDAKQFFVSMTSSPMVGESVIAANVTGRFDLGNIVVPRNYLMEEWTVEGCIGCFPSYQKNDNFTLNILARDYYIKLTFNGNCLCSVYHDIPQDGVNWLIVGGDVRVNNVEVSQGLQNEK